MSDIKLKVKVLTPILPISPRGIEVLARLLREFYAVPENLAAFEKWKKEEDAKKMAGDLIGV